MDDIFSILIYLIVIISFLSSLFKKKTPKAPQEQNRVPRETTTESTTVQSSSEKVNDDYDLMKEIENMFKSYNEKEQETQQRTTKIETAKRTIDSKPSSEHISYEQYASSDESSKGARQSEKARDYGEQQFTFSEHQYTPEKKRKPYVDRRTEEKAKEFQALLERRSKNSTPAVSGLIRKIKNPAAFREYIIVSEILARPKALRR